MGVSTTNTHMPVTVTLCQRSSISPHYVATEIRPKTCSFLFELLSDRQTDRYRTVPSARYAVMSRQVGRLTLLLCYYCVITVLSLCYHCYYCAITVLSLCYYCVMTVLLLCYHCYHCAITMLSLCYHCAITVLSLCYYYDITVLCYRAMSASLNTDGR
jgi:hypothetical protein